jgi:uroporphyrinogen decarboxylase
MRGHTLTDRDNYLRALEFRHPQWVPITFDLLPAVWMRHGDGLRQVALRHPRVFESPNAQDYASQDLEPFARPGQSFRDDWGCVWHNVQAGILGQVVEHPLADWKALKGFRPPDPDVQIDWGKMRERTEQDRAAGRLTRANYLITQGGFFDRLQFLRGLENLLIDFMAEPPELALLIEMVLEYNLKCIRRWLEIGVDQFFFHGDLGTQRDLLLSPDTFRKHLKPAYKEMFMTCRKAGSHVWYSSDGQLLKLVDDLVECGVTLHDPQVRANTLEGIAKAYKGRLCVLVDIDEQMLPFCTPEEVGEQVRQAVETMGDPAGGLMIYACPSADVPLENIEALCEAWEKYCA